LGYADEDALAADVKALRRGYTQAGNWSLPQICYHLTAALKSRMHPGAHAPGNTPEQDARRPMLAEVFRTGRLPDRLPAPAETVPPTNLGDDAIDTYLATLEQWKSFRGPIAPHRIFGYLNEPDARRHNLIHSAHHLSYLTPTSAPARATT
jgi:hypothetical protein